MKDFDKLITDIKKGNPAPIYFLHGEESYYIDKISDLLESEILNEDEKAFNEAILYGKDVDLRSIVNECKQFPMMAEKRLVIVKEAQLLVKTIAQLEDYVKNPTDTTVLCICYKYKKLDGKTRLAKLLKKNGQLHLSEKLKDYKLGDWIINKGSDMDLIVSPKAAILLAEFLGADLNKIEKTLDKLKIVLEGETTVDDKVVFKHVGVSKEFNTFELQKAVATKNVQKANFIAVNFAKNPKKYPLIPTISLLYSFFSKVLIYHDLSGRASSAELVKALGINPYFLKDYEQAARLYTKNKLAKIIGYLRKYDLQSKGVGNSSTEEGEILRELIFLIMH